MTTDKELDDLLKKAAKQQQGAKRPQALDALQTETEEWPTDWLPAPVRDWVEAVASSFAVPRVMPIAAALCVAATITQGKCRVRVKPGWEEPLSLFWLVFSGTAAMKSSVLNLASKPVQAIQEELALEVARDAADARRRKARLESQIRRLQANAKSHRHSDGHREHMRDLQELENESDTLIVPAAPEWLIDDANPPLVLTQMKANLEAEGIARVAVLDAEGTFLRKAMGQDLGHSDLASLLKGYGGEPVRRIRASRTSDQPVRTFLPATYLSLLIMAQPHVLDQMRAKPEMAEEGFMGRCIVTSLGLGDRMPPPDAPPVPERVQEAYGAWVRALHALPPDTVVDLSDHWGPEGALERAYLEVTRHIASGTGAVGWAKRSVGRIARVMALVSLLSELAEGAEGAEGVRGSRVRRCEIQINSLIYILYTRALKPAQANEPTSGTTSALAHRTLTWLQHGNRLLVTERELRRGLTLSAASVGSICQLLVESGHFVVHEEKKNRNRSVTVTYRVTSTDPLGDERPKPTAVPSAEDDGR